MRSFVLGAALVAAIVAAYAFSLRGEFLWDDDLHITANPTIIGPLGLKEIWTSARANYFPLVLTNFWLQHAAWGLEPFGYRVVTLGFHIGAALLLWHVLRQLRVPGAGLGAALWALHPVQVESVAWICELKNTQSAVFFLAAILGWTRFVESTCSRERDRRCENANTDLRPTVGAALRRDLHSQRLSSRHKAAPTAAAVRSFGVLTPSGERGDGSPLAHARGYMLALVFTVLAILSKPSTVMLPVALGLCAWWVRGRVEWRDALRLVPFFALSGLAAGWTIWEQKFHSGAVGPEWSQSLLERVAISGRVVWFYLGKLIWPEPLIFIYPRWEIDVRQPLSFAAIGGLVAALVMLWRGRDGRLRPVFLMSVYFVALLFPVLGFFSVYFFRYSFVGDHFQYLASMAPLALLGAGITRASGRVLPLVTVGLLVALGFATARQSRVYLNNEGLWRDTVAHNPAAVMAWLNLGDTLSKAARYDEALAVFRQALSIRPNDPYGLNDLGNVLVLTGRPDESLAHFERAIALKPDFPDALSNFGHALRSLGQSEEAMEKYRKALELKPDHHSALNNLGAELAQTGKPAEAIDLFERALVHDPANVATLDNLAGALRDVGRMDDALARHRQVLQLNADFPEGQANFGRTLMLVGKKEEALRHFEQALRLKPAFPAARSHYASALAEQGRMSDAMAELKRGAELSPNSAEAQLNLGTALAQAGRIEEAVERFEAVLKITPGFVAAHANLGQAYAALRRGREAIQHFEFVAKAQPNSATAHAQLAIALVNDEQLAAAVPHFATALRLNPGVAEVHDNFGQVLNALGRRREAFEHLEEAARLRRSGAK